MLIKGAPTAIYLFLPSIVIAKEDILALGSLSSKRYRQTWICFPPHYSHRFMGQAFSCQALGCVSCQFDSPSVVFDCCSRHCCRWSHPSQLGHVMPISHWEFAQHRNLKGIGAGITCLPEHGTNWFEKTLVAERQGDEALSDPD